MNAYIRSIASPDSREEPLRLPLGADRRMSRLQKLVCERAYAVLNAAGAPAIAGIYGATALGCLADTEQFLLEMQGEAGTLRSPMPFMRSTHNTMAGQLALLLGITGPNLTFAQDVSGLHAALMAAMLELEEHPNADLLVFECEGPTPLANELLRAVAGPNASLLESADAFVLGGLPRPGDRGRIRSPFEGPPAAFDGFIQGMDWTPNLVLTGGNALVPDIWANVPKRTFTEVTGMAGARTGQVLMALLQQEGVLPHAILIVGFNGRYAALPIAPC